MKTDYLIVGQGLAGSLLAWHLLEAGKRILVVDEDEGETSSKVSAGLVTPVAGSRFHLSPGLEERLDYARGFYWRLEERSGLRFFHHRRIARIFRSREEAERWESKRAGGDPRYERFHAPLVLDPKRLHAPWGGFEMKEGGWLDVPAFLEHTRQTLLERASYAIARLDSADVAAGPAEVRWKNVVASGIVFCEGWRAARNRFFDWIPVQAAGGDILDLRSDGLGEDPRIVNAGGWLLPLGGGRYRAGATYRHGASRLASLDEGRAEVLEKLAAITPATLVVTGHRQALRPTIRRSQVFMGVHPARSRVAFFNGLGSKGALNGPWHARRLAAFLVSGDPLPTECDLQTQFP
jgi:glycine/D-amino acid oxidase-like deaminating enzyme